MEKRKVLLVDDNVEILEELSKTIVEEGYEVVTAGDGDEAWNIFQESLFLVVITDVRMPAKDGFDVLDEIKRYNPATRVIIITGFGGKDIALKAWRRNAFDYIEKGPSESVPNLLAAIQRAFTEADTQIKTEKEMLSFLTHTLRNALSGGRPTVDEVLWLTHNLVGDKYRETGIYEIVNNVASLHSIFTSVENMLDTYKFYVSEPSEINRRWRGDKGGDVRLNRLFALALKQTIARILFEEPNLGQFTSLVNMQNEHSITDVRETFLKNVFMVRDIDVSTDRIENWLNRYFPVLILNINGSGISFNVNGIRFNLLLAIVSEIMYNALKYTDTRRPIEIAWTKDGEQFVFACRNDFSGASVERSGSKKGLSFIRGLTKVVDGMQFSYNSEDNVFSAELLINNSLLDAGGDNV